MLNKGSRLGPYEILAVLGTGGMGVVYRARDDRLDREVAVKVLPDQIADAPDALARFHREARALAALSHPNVLAIHDIGTDATQPYVVMELLAGETLRARLTRAPLSWQKTVEVAIAVADGLSAAHAKGIAHRDLKPENIFLTADGQVKVVDFGLASAVRAAAAPTAGSETTVSNLTDHGTVLGTVGYMSPEQVRGDATGPSSDTFSFGCVLYEMLSGRKAFGGRTAADTMAAILHSDPPSLEASATRIPTALTRIVARCLEKTAAERFQSARDLAFALKDVLRDADARSTPVASRSRVPIRASIAAVVVLTLVMVAAYWFETDRRPADEAISSIAILPLTNATGSADVEYLADGIAETLINGLAQLPQLRVIARTTVFRYKGQQDDPQRVGRELGVRAVFTGRVVQHANVLSIQADLVDVETGAQLWGERFDQQVGDVLAVQADAARRIAEGLRLELTGAEAQQLTKRHTDSSEAYELYLKGRFHSARMSAEGFDRGLAFLTQATTIDPNYALAHAGLVEHYTIYFDPQLGDRMRDAANKAVALDVSLAEAHYAMALAAAVADWDWAGAEREFQKALALSAGSAATHDWYGWFLANIGRTDQAIHHLTIAQQLDPLSVKINAFLGRSFYFARRYREADVYLRKAIDLDPQFWFAHIFLGLSLQQQRAFEQAIAEARIVERIGFPDGPAYVAHALAVAGRRAEAISALRTREWHPWAMATAETGLGNKDEAFRWLEKAYEQRFLLFPSITVDPVFDSLRSDPRFDDLLRRLRLGA